MIVALANDHAGFALRPAVLEALSAAGCEILDFGCRSEDSVDYPEFGRQAALAVAEGRAERAILICGTGIGMSIVANKIRGVRCALCRDANDAQMARRHNNANALALRGRGADPAESRRIIEVFLTEPYEGGRHQRRLDQIAALEVAPGGACGSR